MAKGLDYYDRPNHGDNPRLEMRKRDSKDREDALDEAFALGTQRSEFGGRAREMTDMDDEEVE